VEIFHALRSRTATGSERCFFGSRYSVAPLRNLADFATEIRLWLTRARESTYCELTKLQTLVWKNRSDVTNSLTTSRQLIGRCHKPSIVILNPDQKSSAAIGSSITSGHGVKPIRRRLLRGLSARVHAPVIWQTFQWCLDGLILSALLSEWRVKGCHVHSDSAIHVNATWGCMNPWMDHPHK